MFNYRLFVLVTALILGTALTGILRLQIDTDVVRSLPAGETIIQDGLEIFQNHPIHEQMGIDIQLDQENPELLVQCGDFVEEKLLQSKLFTAVGTKEVSTLIPDIALLVVDNLPFLFSKEELEQDIAPRLEQQFIDQYLKKQLVKLGNLEGIGQARFIAEDPLGFMEPVMAKMALMAPFKNSKMYKSHLLSSDNLHLMIIARPNSTGTDTGGARKLSDLFTRIADELNEQYAGQNITVTMTPIGAYRAALDNETIIRHDVNLALFLSIFGIALLLLTAFPRPLLGLLSFLPAIAGTAAALFVFSLVHNSISIMVLGFGGAIISITVDHGIAYLLFLDRPQKTRGKEASHEVRAVGILAVLTTCGAFLLLSFSNFPIFVQLGQFTALGVLFSFLFVHFIFPHITPGMPASTKRNLPLQGVVDRLYSTGRIGAIAATLFAAVMIFWMRPDFNVSLESMSTVSQDTIAADALFKDVWGDISNKVFLMNSEEDIVALQNKNDALLQKLSSDEKKAIIAPSFLPSMIFPGTDRSRENLAAWHQFWEERRETFESNLQTIALQNGFNKTAFVEFNRQLQPSYQPLPAPLPEKFYTLMGITEHDGHLLQFITLTPGSNYSAQNFYNSYGKIWKTFDSQFFSAQLADILFNTFATMLGLIAISVVILLFFFFLSWQLTLITLAPPVFSYICTLGTMKLIGHSLDIPGLMLSIVILGMGIDYSIFFVRAQQRYRSPAHPAFKRIRMAVFMAGSSTLIGFGVLCSAEHSMLRSVGITSLLGIGYSLLGAFLLLPPLLHYFFDSKRTGTAADADLPLGKRLLKRYALMEAYPKMFARFKLQYDPLFTDLQQLLEKERQDIKTILDIGCGYGVPACWVLEYFPQATLTGIDPDPERVRVANLATGERGKIIKAMAPELPVAENSTDLTLILDMLHYLDDNSARILFSNCFQVLSPGAILLIRFVTRPEGKPTKPWLLEDYRVKLSGNTAYYRSGAQMADLLTGCGFTISTITVSEANSELIWIIATA